MKTWQELAKDEIEGAAPLRAEDRIRHLEYSLLRYAEALDQKHADTMADIARRYAA